MKYKIYFILACLSLFSLTGHSFFHEEHFDHDHEEEIEFCTLCHFTEVNFLADFSIEIYNKYPKNYFFSSQKNLSYLTNQNFFIRAPPI